DAVARAAQRQTGSESRYVVGGGRDQHDVELEGRRRRRVMEVSILVEDRARDRVRPADEVLPLPLQIRIASSVDAGLPVAETQRGVLACLVREVGVVGLDPDHPEIRVGAVEVSDGGVVVPTAQLLYALVVGSDRRQRRRGGNLRERLGPDGRPRLTGWKG